MIDELCKNSITDFLPFTMNNIEFSSKCFTLKKNVKAIQIRREINKQRDKNINEIIALCTSIVSPMRAINSY